MAERLRPQLTAVVTEVVDSIAEHVPSYTRPLEGSFGQDVRSGVQVALARFLDELAGTDEPVLTGSDKEFYVALGRDELRQGGGQHRGLCLGAVKPGR